MRRLAADGALDRFPVRFQVGQHGEIEVTPGSGADWDLEITCDGSWDTALTLDREAAALLDLYLEVCVASAGQPCTVAHLGQSVDGQIATVAGESRYVTGQENFQHLHRMRALADAVIVGADTVDLDDPRLTTRLVAGPSPLRVVIDPGCRLSPDRGVFREPAAPTLLVCRDDAVRNWTDRIDHLDVLALPASDAGLDPRDIVAGLRARGCSLLFLEGGGRTVSRFLEAGAVDRLQVAIAPLIMGEGRPGLSLAGVESLAKALRPATRWIPMGQDMLLDCDFRGTAKRS